jgi:outer membrane protein
LGLGVGVFQSPYLGDDNKTRALPLLHYENRWLRVVGTSADLKLGQWALGSASSIAVTGRLKYDGLGYKAADALVLAGMDERKGGFWAGGSATWMNPWVRATAEWTADASSHSKGQKASLQLDRRFSVGSLGITPRIQAQWLDKKYVDYYFGVKANEATSTRSQYTGKAATALEVGLRLDYALAPKQTLFLDISATQLPDAIKLSPIVGRSSLSRATMGYLYRF